MENIQNVFYEKFNAILGAKREDNNFYLSTKMYDKCVEDVLKFKGIESKQLVPCASYRKDMMSLK